MGTGGVSTMSTSTTTPVTATSTTNPVTSGSDSSTTTGSVDTGDESTDETGGDTEGGEVECGAKGDVACGDDVVVGGELCLGAPVEAATGAGISGLAVFDFDDDGIDDVIVGQGGATNALLLRGGAGGLTQLGDVSLQSQQRDIATGDLDGDGVADVVSLGVDERRLTVRHGDGTGTFSFAPHVTAGMEGASSISAISVGDLNGDDRDDVVVVYYSRADVYLSDVEGIPASPIEYTYPANLEGGTRAVLADLDGANGLDMVIGTYDTGTFGVYFNNGAASFGAPDIYEVAPGGSSDGVGWVRAADIDQDDNLDLVIDDFDNNSIFPHLFDADGAAVPGNAINRWGGGGFQLGDLDDDCASDLAVHDGSDDSIAVFINRNDASGLFAVPEVLPFGGGTIIEIESGDFNGDGVADLVVAGPSSVRGYYSNP